AGAAAAGAGAPHRGNAGALPAQSRGLGAGRAGRRAGRRGHRPGRPQELHFVYDRGGGRMSGRWHPAYKRIVLERGFETHRTHFFSAMMDASLVHVLQLVRQGIIRPQDGRQVAAALLQVRGEGPEALSYDDRFEDLFFLLEHRLALLAGEEAVGSMHVALSRNDLDTTMYRLVLREEVLQVAALLARLRRTLLDLAQQHVETVMPAYTHGQQ